MNSNSPLTFQFEKPDAIRRDILETFPYEGNPQRITYKTREFSAVCPFSGLPDLAEIIIEYIPDHHCIELKSLKLYLTSYRNVGIYQEHATDRLFTDIFQRLQPKWQKITTIYATRGGIDAICVMEKGDPDCANQLN